ncbi:MAG: transposase [Thermoguttaceae bacterium]|nr:transposase [Thermoguttaceae bacterium]
MQRKIASVNECWLGQAKILLYVVENGCKWRALPKEFGNWHTVYMRMCRWAENGVLFHLFEALQNELKLHVDTSALSLDSRCMKVHHGGRRLKKRKTLDRQNTWRPGTPGCEFALPCGWLWSAKQSLHSWLLLLLIHTMYYSNIHYVIVANGTLPSR